MTKFHRRAAIDQSVLEAGLVKCGFKARFDPSVLLSLRPHSEEVESKCVKNSLVISIPKSHMFYL